MLIEFDYDKNLIPTFSFINPQQESWFAWIMKEQMLKPAYLGMLKGKV
jgi:sulfide:quinone oxidoreductase